MTHFGARKTAAQRAAIDKRAAAYPRRKPEITLAQSYALMEIAQRGGIIKRYAVNRWTDAKSYKSRRNVEWSVTHRIVEALVVRGKLVYARWSQPGFPVEAKGLTRG